MHKIQRGGVSGLYADYSRFRGMQDGAYGGFFYSPRPVRMLVTPLARGRLWDTVRSGNMPFSHFWPAVVSSLLASVQFELLLPSFLARAHRPKGIDCPVTSEPGR